MNISNHARQRMKERCGFNRKAQDRMAMKALNDGITHKQTKGRLHKWVTSLFLRIAMQTILGCLEILPLSLREKRL